MIDFFILIFQSPKVTSQSERYLLIYMTIALILITSLVIVFFIVFQKRKNKLILDKIKQQQDFEEELSNAQLEIQEQTLKNIGQELHDNIGQLLSVANMQLSILNAQVPDEIKESFTETKKVVKESLGEVRALSKSLNNEVISNRGFQNSVQNEVDRLNKLKLLKAELNTEGNPAILSNAKDSIILLRIIQEFFSNTIKYAQASKVSVSLNYLNDKLEIKVEDDGNGFDINEIEKGSGLINMKSRAELVGVDFKLTSQKGKGTQLNMAYPYREISKIKL